MRLSVRLFFAVLMLVTAAWSQAPAQVPAQAPAQAPAPASAQAPAPAPIFVQNPLDASQQFSADMSGGRQGFNKLKIYRSGNQMRADWTVDDEYRISNLTTRNGWVIRPREWVTRPKACRPMSMMDIATYPFFAYTDKDFKVEHLSTAEKETIDGHSCKVENYKVTPKDGRPQYVIMKLWEAEDLNGFPIQMEIAPSVMPKFTLTYTDVSLERPDPKLFRLPALCRAGHPKKKAPASTSKAPTQAAPKPPQ